MANLNTKIFDTDVEQAPIRKGWNANTWSIPKQEAGVPSWGRGIFQQKNIRDLVNQNFSKILC